MRMRGPWVVPQATARLWHAGTMCRIPDSPLPLGDLSDLRLWRVPIFNVHLSEEVYGTAGLTADRYNI